MDPIFFDAYDIRLASNAGTLTLRDGSIGKLITITFEQDGVGGFVHVASELRVVGRHGPRKGSQKLHHAA